MNPENFAEWFRRQGHTVIQTTSSYWVNSGPRIYQAFPYHWIISPEEQEIRHLLSRHRAIGLRYSTPWDMPIGKASYHVVAEKGRFDPGSLPRRVRQDIRKGLDYATIEPIPIGRMSKEGWRLRHETLLRQGRMDAENEAWWVRMCLSAEDLPGFEAWGAIHDGQLVSAMLAVSCDDCYTFLYHQSLSDHLKYGINNALFYTITEQTLKRPEVSQNFVALHSLDALSQVDVFKFRMRYEARPLRQRVVFHPWFAPLIGRATYRGVRWIEKRLSKHSAVSKAEGMLRFYLEGLLPIDQQSIPEVLGDYVRSGRSLGG